MTLARLFTETFSQTQGRRINDIKILLNIGEIIGE